MDSENVAVVTIKKHTSFLKLYLEGEGRSPEVGVPPGTLRMFRVGV